jgi:CBS domain containing-hemolysin-like protein
VVDEHGSTAGLVTLDDLLGELMGEIEDEFDDHSVDIRVEADGSMLVDGSTDIGDFADQCGCAPPEGEYSTVGGLFMSLTRELPALGQRASFGDVQLEVAEVSGRRIITLRVKRQDDEPESPSEGVQP